MLISLSCETSHVYLLACPRTLFYVKVAPSTFEIVSLPLSTKRPFWGSTLRLRMSHEKFDAQDNLGSKDTAPYTSPSSEEDVEEGQPKPLMRALESRHMQMIAIVSPSLSPTLLQGTTKKNKFPNAQKLSVRAVLSVPVYSLVRVKHSLMEVLPPSLSAIQLSDF
jgi:hypothetical protein